MSFEKHNFAGTGTFEITIPFDYRATSEVTVCFSSSTGGFFDGTLETLLKTGEVVFVRDKTYRFTGREGVELFGVISRESVLTPDAQKLLKGLEELRAELKSVFRLPDKLISRPIAYPAEKRKGKTIVFGDDGQPTIGDIPGLGRLDEALKKAEDFAEKSANAASEAKEQNTRMLAEFKKVSELYKEVVQLKSEAVTAIETFVTSCRQEVMRLVLNAENSLTVSQNKALSSIQTCVDEVKAFVGNAREDFVSVCNASVAEFNRMIAGGKADIAEYERLAAQQILAELELSLKIIRECVRAYLGELKDAYSKEWAESAKATALHIAKVVEELEARISSLVTSAQLATLLLQYTLKTQLATSRVAGLVKLFTDTELSNSSATPVQLNASGQMVLRHATQGQYGAVIGSGKGVRIDNVGRVQLALRANHSGIDFSGNDMFVQTAEQSQHPAAGTVAPTATDTNGKIVVLNATDSLPGGVKLATSIDDTGEASVLTAAQVKEATQQKVDEEAIALQKTSLTSGNVHKTIYDPVSKKYFTTTNTGVYSSLDGFNWICCLEGWFTSIATDDAGTILVGAYGAIPVSNPNSNSKGIWKSTDGGNTWTETNWQIATDNNNYNAKGAIWALGYGNGVWIAGTSGACGILRSTDGGDNWELSNKTNGSYYAVAYHNGVHYIGLDSNGAGLEGILKSTDGGATWTQTNCTTGWYSHIQYYESIGMFLAAEFRAGRVMYSTDGDTWTETFNSTAIYGIAVDGEGKFYVYGYGNSRIARSSDGKNWEWITDTLPNRAYGIYGANGLLLFGTYGAGMLAQSMLRGGYVTKDEALSLNVPANVELNRKIDRAENTLTQNLAAEVTRAKEAESLLTPKTQRATTDALGLVKVGGKGVGLNNNNQLVLTITASHSGLEFYGKSVFVNVAEQNVHPTAGTVAPVATDTAGKLVVLNASASLPGGVMIATGIDDTRGTAVVPATLAKSIISGLQTRIEALENTLANLSPGAAFYLAEDASASGGTIAVPVADETLNGEVAAETNTDWLSADSSGNITIEAL